MKFILGKKLGMSQIFDGKEGIIPVTLIEAGPCVVTQIKTKDKDGYRAVQIGFEKNNKSRPSAEGEKNKKSKKKNPFRWLREFRSQDIEKNPQQLKVGDEITVAIFQDGDKVKISGISKGKGFQGAVKRWGFSGRNATHGVKHEHRTLGSVGSSFPERVIKGKKMPGRMGFEKVTVKNLKIVKTDKENNLLAIRGALPGPKGAILEIRG